MKAKKALVRPKSEGVKKSAAKGQPSTRSVRKALDALDLLGQYSRPVPLNELARRLSLGKSSAFRLLQTLHEAGYLERPDTGLYSLPPAMRRLLPSRFLVHLPGLAAAPMKQLGLEFRENVSLAFLFENHIEVIAVIESPEMIRMSNVVGRILPPHSSSLGKAIMAWQTEERRDKLLDSFGLYRFTPATMTDHGELNDEFNKTRERGYATDLEENVAGGRCYGVPIIVEGSRVVAALSISIPNIRIPDSNGTVRLVTALQDAAAEIATGLAQLISK